uniref:Lysosomal acid phosphatase n=1 Tax=Myripristis murdjan TaxID=586833 RepID=A0A667X9D5_9TELE
MLLIFRFPRNRSPVRAYPNDPYKESSWPQGFGQLSQEGMRQHLELGQFLRKRYQGFLNESYDRHEISVRSTDYDRTLMSAEANLAGLYPPEGRQVFTPNLSWQPIPVHTVPQSQERLLSFPLGDCPRYKQLMSETEKTDEFISVTNKYKDIIDLVRNETGLNSTTVESVWSVYDTLFCEARHNLTAPDWVTAEVMEKLRILKDFGFQVMAVKCSSCRVQWQVISHDTTIAALQASLNVFSGRQPPYASCHIFELYRDNGSFSVSMFYRNDSTVEPYPLLLPNCTLDCPLDDFVRLTKPSIAEDRDKECQVSSKRENKNVIIGLAVSGCLLFFFIVILLSLICRQKEPSSSHRYRHVINQDGGEES